MRLKGQVERIYFSSSETPFQVFLLKRLSRSSQGVWEFPQEEVVVVGEVEGVSLGDCVTVQGELVRHPRYGEQVRAETLFKSVPKTCEGLALFLRGQFAGIGEKRASLFASLYEKIGDDLEKLREEALQRSFPKRPLQEILSWLKERRGEEELLIALMSLGISPSLSRKLLTRYKDQAYAKVLENPYRLFEEFAGVGFLTADQLGVRLGMETSKARFHAAYLYVLKREREAGHIYLSLADLKRQVAQLIRKRGSSDLCSQEVEVFEEDFLKSPHSSSLEKGLSAVPAPQRGRQAEELVREGGRVYLGSAWQEEVETARRVAQLLRQPPHPALFSKRGKLALFLHAKRLDPDQKAAALQALHSPLSIVTGGAGTGKTYILRQLCAFLEEEGVHFACAAPTGRAAQRMVELCGVQAKTLHRLLEFDPTTETFQRFPERPLELDLLIADEASMVDSSLFHALLLALPEKAHLLLIGDHRQLPPVGPGEILRDCLETGKVPATRLSRIYRTRQGALLRNAHRVLRGEWLDLSPSDGSFQFIGATSPEDAQEKLLRLAAAEEREHRRFQLLSPIHRGPAGVGLLNARLLAQLYPPSAVSRQPSADSHQRGVPKGSSPKRVRPFFRGEKVIYSANNYKLGVFNGDIGWVEKQDLGKITVSFHDRTVSIDAEDNHLAPAYCISVHKAQGSEFDKVAFPLLSSHYFFLHRALFYTALTRARRSCILVGEKRALFMCLKRERLLRRRTTLRERILQELEKTP